jgi:tetratricopeptide (TPR) repeat protein
MELEEWEAALPDFEKVTRLTKEDLLKADALVRISFLKHKLGRNKEALQDVETAIGLNAFNVHAYYYKGLILIGLGELEKGCEELKDALLLGLEGTEKTGAEALIAENCGE